MSSVILDPVHLLPRSEGLFDFSKAFDCLADRLIIKKLRVLGISGMEAQWLDSYLSNRTQMIEITYKENHKIHKVKSKAVPITRRVGLPQVSDLGPVLYILLANAFPQYLEEFWEAVMLVDDTALNIANKNTQQLERDSYIAYSMAKQYCYQKDLILNES